MDVRTIILGFLTYGEMSGYDIKQAFSHSIGFFYDASFGAIYPALRKLEEEGYVTKQEVIQSGKPNKILYKITKAGKDLFQQEISGPVLPPVLRSDMLVKLYFNASRTRQEQAQLLQECIELQQKLLTQTEESFAKFSADFDRYQRFCWEYTLHQLEQSLAFLRQRAPLLLNQEEILQNS
ncbi:PadR family transcriptional regulator [Brevibacillus fulvus]|uniref:DNA-binding PadR family transcriptional regulator n=1 Tax=Brevibacillus fulvus TaxID=1125967 RepID=A0A938XVA9_9BACL|nr:PadR family transcriptional regulator [Brevibacillus fulvus]MBM7590782.1 DNA-binding PadR family transcriptional regulator [Brevibacillus fulvus]